MPLSIRGQKQFPFMSVFKTIIFLLLLKISVSEFSETLCGRAIFNPKRKPFKTCSRAKQRLCRNLIPAKVFFSLQDPPMRLCLKVSAMNLRLQEKMSPCADCLAQDAARKFLLKLAPRQRSI